MNNLILNIKTLTSYDSIKKYDFSNNKIQNVYTEIIEAILSEKVCIENLKDILNGQNKKLINIYFYNEEKPRLIINKICLLNAILEYIELKDFKNIEISKQMHICALNLSYESIMDKDKIYCIDIDNKKYEIPIHYFYDFLSLENNLYELFTVYKEPYYKGIEIEVFVYALINYFETNHYFEFYKFPDYIINRFLKLKELQIIDFESINKIKETKDPYLKDVKLNSAMEDFLFREKDKYNYNKLEYVINIYLELCNKFTYDDAYYIDPLSFEGMKHTKISFLEQINEKNNRIVCFEFTAIFGYFLNKINIPYEVIQQKSEYGYLHNYIKLRYDKFLIRIEPIKTILNSDLTAVKTGTSLVGIECLNKNDNTRLEFNKILKKCYKSKKITIDQDILPTNKFDYENEDFSSKIKRYIQKIDLVIKKINDIDLPIVDKVAYFRALIKFIFTRSELELNISDCIIIKNSNPKKLVFAVALNELSYMNSDNYYLIYDENLNFIKKDDLQKLFNKEIYEYLNEKEIPGIKRKC